MLTNSDLDALRIAVPGEPGGLSLLLVEDDEADAYLIKRALADNPAVGKVTHARDGVEALRMVECGEVAPDLALIDLHMPLMDGFSLLVAFTNNSSVTFPMVVLTSSSSPSDAIRSRMRNAVRVITKPDSVEGMCALFQAVIKDVCRLGHPDAEFALPPQEPDLLLNPVRGGAAADGRAAPSERAWQIAAESDDLSPQPFTAAAHLARIRDCLSEQEASLRGLRVLAAEDNLTNQLVLTALLSVAGLDLTMVSNGQEAFDAWRAGQWDLVLMDVQMPVMDGVTATRRIRDAERREGLSRTPIIAVTANATPDDKVNYLAAGMDQLVAKPIKFVVLMQSMNEALQSPPSGKRLGPECALATA